MDRTLKNRLTAIILIFVLTTPAVVMWTTLQYQKYQVRKEVKQRMIAGIPRENLVRISLTSAEARRELEWEHAREFEYQDHMYDVVETVVRGDTTHYWCWPDDAETILNHKLAELTCKANQSDPRQHDTRQRLLSLIFSGLYLVPEKTAETSRPDSVSLFRDVVFKPDSLAIRPPSPPPRA